MEKKMASGKFKIQIRWVTVRLLLLLLLLGSFGVRASAKELKTDRVLFISSYSCAWQPVTQQMEGIKEKLGDETLIDYQFMDTKNVNTKEAIRLFYERISYFLQKVPDYDVVIVGDDAAFHFVMEYKKELFPDTPIIFEGVENVSEALEAGKDPLISGVLEKLSYKNTLKVAHQIYPEATHVTAILDDTVSGQAERDEYYKYKEKFPELTFEEIDASKLSEEELLQAVSKLGDDHILIYVICSEDKYGDPYPITQIVHKVTQTAQIPVFSIMPHSMGYGLLGGELVSHQQMGEIAGTMAREILDGTDPSEIKIQQSSPRTYCFDENVMERFHIRASQLPKGAEIINHKVTVMERYGAAIKISLLIVAVLLLVIHLLVLDNRKKKHLNDKMVKVNEKLRYASHYDVLTSLLNRRAMMEDLEKLIAGKKEFAIIMFDMDGFKKVNDVYGHNAGDQVLKEIASRAKKITHPDMDSYRLGGDEFVCIIASGKKEVIDAGMEQVKGIFADAYQVGGDLKQFHSSMGVARYPQDADNATELLAVVDERMYEMKKAGKSSGK